MIKAKIDNLRIKGMNKSCCGLREMEILKRILKESKILNKKNTFLELYKATRDGFEGKTFHNKCDGKENLLILIKANNFLFGGFTNGAFKSREVKNLFPFHFSPFKKKRHVGFLLMAHFYFLFRILKIGQ